jgi:hypothetical protein
MSMNAHHTTSKPIEMRLPDMTGVNGRRAWRSRVPNAGSARLATWIMDVPFAHPAWRYWIATVVTLKPIEGVAEAFKQYPEAEYQVLVAALYTGGSDIVDIDRGRWSLLEPVDFLYQFHGVTNQDAEAMLYDYTRAVVERGVMSPDADYRRSWGEWFHSLLRQFRDDARMS